MEKQIVIAVDFDGTCVTHEYPNIGRDIGAVQTLKKLIDNGCKIVLNTMRSGVELDEAVNWFKQNGIELFGVNNNPEQISWTTSPKVYAQIYIDDAAIGCPLIFGLHSRPYVDWVGVERFLFNH